MIRYLLLCFFLTSLLGTANANENINATNGMWVAIRVQDNGTQLTEYHGWLEKKVFWKIISNQFGQGFIRLRDIHWLNSSGQTIPLEKARPNQLDYGYGRDVFIRVEHISRIVPLRDEFTKDIKPNQQRKK